MSKLLTVVSPRMLFVLSHPLMRVLRETKAIARIVGSLMSAYDLGLFGRRLS
jgi:hypothetical protein